MADPDFNLLPALDVLLREGSVAGAARVLELSASAMSRTLLRLRAATGDPLLVRAGRRLVPTPHALALRDRVHALAHDARAVLRPAAGKVDLLSLDRVFTLRANEGFVEAFAARLVTALSEAAPGVRLRFAPKPDKGVQALRDGAIDLEIGVLGDTGPEVKVQALFQDRFVGVVRQGHALASGAVTPERYAACGHVVASRRGRAHGPVDEALAALRRGHGAELSGRHGGGSIIGVGRAGDAFLRAGWPRRVAGVRLRAAGPDYPHHRIANVAPSRGCRPGASLAAGNGAVRLPPALTSAALPRPGPTVQAIVAGRPSSLCWPLQDGKLAAPDPSLSFSPRSMLSGTGRS